MKSSLVCLLVSLVACGDNLGAPDGGGGGDGGIDGTSGVKPTVVSNLPAANALDVAVNASASITFSLPMDRTSMSSAFTLTTEVGSTAIPGTVITSGATAAFWPAARLANNTAFVATISTAAKSTEGVALAAQHTWKFTTGVTVAPGQGVNLGTAGDFVLLAKSGITNVPTSSIRGNIGVSPITSTAITGLPLTPDTSTQFSTTPEVTGRVYAPDFAAPTPSYLTTAVSDMETAFVDAAGRAPGVTELGAGTIGTVTLVPGVYTWATGLLIPTDVTLTGSATDVWVFQVAQNLTVAGGIKVVLAGDALPKNVFWQVAGAVDLGTTSHMEGVVLCQTAITLKTGSSINGRLLAQTAVTLAASTVVQPAN